MQRSENGALVGNLVEMRMVSFFSACLHCHFQGISMDELFPPRTAQSSIWGTTQLRHWLHLWSQSRVLNLPQPLKGMYYNVDKYSY